MQGQAGNRLAARRSTTWVGPVAVAAGLLVTSCGGGGPLAGPGRISTAGMSATPGRPAGPTGNPSSESELVASAWIAAQQAFDSAALSADPSAPGLAATTVPPQIDASRSLLEQMREAGELAAGVVRFGTPQVGSIRATLASVRSCVHDAEIVVSATSGVPVAGVLGEVDYELIESTMESTPSGWKLMTQTVGAGRCTGR